MNKKLAELNKYSDIDVVKQKALQYLGSDFILFVSPLKNKKYRIYNPINEKWVDFGQMGYEDFTKHKDKARRDRYLKRATKIRGRWRDNPYSANNLSIHLLW